MNGDANMNGAAIVLRALKDQGVEVVFGYPGGAVLPIYDELFKQNDIRHILVRHEQGAVHAAEGYARSTGRTGVVLVTSGPGVTNAVTGLADAMMDSVPIICLSGQVPTHMIGTDAFQECDTTGVTRPCSKHNYLVHSVDGLARTLHEAFYIARTGRPGPVVVDIPKNIQFAKGRYTPPTSVRHRTYSPRLKAERARVEEAVDMLLSAKRPIIYAGGGVINSGDAACQLLSELVRISNFPITLTLMGLGAAPAAAPQFLGMLGMHGCYEANWAMHDCDVMLCVGARFDDRITGRLDAFSPGSRKIHIDIDPSSINKNVRVDLPLVGDAAYVLEDMLNVWKSRQQRPDAAALKEWWRRIDGWRARDCLKFETSKDVIKPQQAIRRLYDLLADRDPLITTEVGQHQMWAAQHFRFQKPKRWMTSGGLGTMGYGLPAAIGAQVAHPGRLVIDIAGEASILMNIQEMSTAKQYRLPVKVFILNNRYMGMVRQWQELLHGGRYSESYSESLPDFKKLAEAYGWLGITVSNPEELDAAILQMADHDGPVLADIAVDPHENCYPMIPSGEAHNAMLLGPVAEGEEVISDAGKILV